MRYSSERIPTPVTTPRRNYRRNFKICAYVGLTTLCTSATPSPLAPKSRPASSPHCTGKEDRGGSAAGMGRLGDPSLPFIFDGRCGADYAFGDPFVPNGRVGSPQRTQTSGADAPSARLKGSVPHIDILWFPLFRAYACQGIIRLLLGSDGQSASKQPGLNTAETAMPPYFAINRGFGLRFIGGLPERGIHQSE